MITKLLEPDTKNKQEIAPCENCQWVAKRIDHQERHIKRCNLLPSPQHIISLLSEGMTKKGVAEKYSTIQTSISESFIHRLAERFGYDASSKSNTNYLPRLMDWHEKATPCSRCGILTHESIEEIPGWLGGKTHWFVSYPTVHIGLNWSDKNADIGSPVCQMCHSEPGGK